MCVYRIINKYNYISIFIAVKYVQQPSYIYTLLIISELVI